ncbi:putative bifunctional diguanylate cyclase/phosphodiesterase [Roseateles cellulosilyticus]|uniref:EAL domain-containing protein n=1 Tax=Pelomonas cellulosilytica TaxID=2906762 RepID=A0ABS8XVJ3_9BURK|nr:EAL domain-containing protein [Pelomonas sp. P8]MCE4556704.1 EAL domain-containing protein [Pelomonas sp. P8]
MARTEGFWDRLRQTFELYVDGKAESARIRAEHLAQLTRLTPLLMAANLISGGLVRLAVGDAGGVLLAGWLVVLGAVAALGLLGWWKRRRHVAPQVSSRGYRRGTWHAAVLGLCWGGAAALWFAPAGPAERVLIATLVTGMLGAGAFALAMLPWASIVYTWLIVAGALVALWRAGDVIFLAVAVLLLSYATVVSFAAMALARQSTALLRARFTQAHQQQVVSLLLRDFEENASDALWETDAEGHLVHRSPRLASLFGVPQERLGEVQLPQWFATRALASGPVVAAWAVSRPFRDLKLQLGRGDHARWWAISAKPITEPDGVHVGCWRGVIADITEAQRFENQLRLQAEQDALTGLANRRALMNAAQAAMALGRAGWLLSIDLDHFKVVNDSSGHSAGDEVLRVVAGRLLALVEEGDLVGRLGGDEFAMLRLGEAPVRAPQAMAALIIDKLSQPIHVGAKRLHVGASVGLARLDASVANVEDLMVNADLALYDAKRSGRGRSVVYASSLGAASRRMHTIEQALREGLAHGQFELHFQPKVDARSLRALGVEALMRWEHPVLGSISPGEFIPAAERCGLIRELGALALEHACLAARELPRLSVAVNVSPLQLMEPGFVKSVERMLVSTGVGPSLLHLEVTESLMMEDAQAAFKRLHALRELGVHVALDDFGTGFSSLAYLRAFPFHTLKIDRSFVRSLTEHSDARAIVNTIVQMAGVLGMRTVAEGVETERELAIIRSIRCHEVQGYLVARPMSLPKLKDWLAGRPITGPIDDVDSRITPWRRTQISPPTTMFGAEI